MSKNNVLNFLEKWLQKQLHTLSQLSEIQLNNKANIFKKKSKELNQLEQDLEREVPVLFTTSLEHKLLAKCGIMPGSVQVETPGAWDDLVIKMVSELQSKHPNIRFLQIKEKFGQLRVYVSSKNDEAEIDYDSINEVISEYEKLSTQICQVCGSKEEVGRKPGYWVMYVCKEHLK